MDLEVLHCHSTIMNHRPTYGNNLATAQQHQQKCNNPRSTPPSVRRNIVAGNTVNVKESNHLNYGNNSVNNSNNCVNSSNNCINNAVNSSNNSVNNSNNLVNNCSNPVYSGISNSNNSVNNSNNSVNNSNKSVNSNNSVNNSNKCANSAVNRSNNFVNNGLSCSINTGINNLSNDINVGLKNLNLNTKNINNSPVMDYKSTNNAYNINNNSIFSKESTYHDLVRRPCLLTDENKVVRVRKTVVFADARGLALTQVRIMSEPSEIPPFWTQRFISHLTAAATGMPTSQSGFLDQLNHCRGTNSQMTNNFETWLPNFEQPARDYVEFRRKLEETNVALENLAVLRSDANDFRSYGHLQETNSVGTKMVGTVKVRNLDYHKEVTLRYTTDGWNSYQDVLCSHVPAAPASSKLTFGGSYVLHDTFRFEVSLPAHGDCAANSAHGTGGRVEFCLRFRCAGRECWDNNRGSNYAVVRRHQGSAQPHRHGAEQNTAHDERMIKKVQEATAAKIGAWSEFASWEHLENNCPYW